MKKLTRYNKPACMQFARVLVSASLFGLCLNDVALAEDKVWEIQSGNKLSKIVADQYPGYGNRQAIMQEILKRNPEAFVGQDINRLIVGKTLKLPAADEIPDLESPAPSQEGGIDSATQEKLQALEAQVAEQKETIAILEEENASLQEMVKDYAEAKPAAVSGDDLQKQLDTAKQELQSSQANAKTLEEQLAASKQENEALRNDLQQVQAAAAVADDKDSSSGSLPWLLLGLLALLTLPLIWLLRRKQERTPLAARVEPADAVPVPEPVPVGAAETHHPATAAEAPVTADVAENPDAGLKLDIARAYLDLRDSEAAADILQDVLVEGGERQRQEAREILSFIA